MTQLRTDDAAVQRLLDDIYTDDTDEDAEALGRLQQAYRDYRYVEAARQQATSMVTAVELVAAANVLANAAAEVLDRFMFTGAAGETSVTDPGVEYITFTGGA